MADLLPLTHILQAPACLRTVSIGDSHDFSCSVSRAAVLTPGEMLLCGSTVARPPCR